VEGFEESAIAIETLIGNSLFDLSNRSWSEKDLERICWGIRGCFRAITDCQVEHRDGNKLENFMLIQRPSHPISASFGIDILLIILLCNIELGIGKKYILIVRTFYASVCSHLTIEQALWIFTLIALGWKMDNDYCWNMLPLFLTLCLQPLSTFADTLCLPGMLAILCHTQILIQLL
jgi:hypothetical protein